MLLLCKPKRSVFYSVPVENGCLWFRAFPEIVAGQRLSAVRADAFTRLLTDLVARLKSPKRPFQYPQAEQLSMRSHTRRGETEENKMKAQVVNQSNISATEPSCGNENLVKRKEDELVAEARGRP